jgi:serine/threonine protein kinase
MERDRIVICYCRSENENPDFCALLEVMLRGLQNAQQGRLQFRVEPFDDERLGKPDGVDQLRDVLSRARVVVLLEGPDFMASNFVLDELTLDCIETLQRYTAATVFRVPIRPVAVVPQSFADLQLAWGKEPLKGLDVYHRDDAMVKIVESLAAAFLAAGNPAPSEDRDEFDTPPFVTCRGRSRDSPMAGWKVFIGSTAVDLPKYRRAAIEVCQELGLEPIFMERFPPDPRNAVEYCRARVHEADAYLGIYAHRYGYVPDGSDLSLTEMEYNWAIERQLPILIFSVNEEFLWSPKMVDGGEALAKLQAFKAKVGVKHVLKSFTTVELFRADLYPALLPYHDAALEARPRSDDSPRPTYRDRRTEELGERLRLLKERQRDLLIARAGPEELERNLEEIRAVKREQLRGGRLKEGYPVSDRYRLLEVIGAGGFATVWRAFDELSREVVALKVLHGQHGDDPARRERFFRGAHQMALLGHPHIVRVIQERGEDDGQLYFVMEYLVGGDFQRKVLDGGASLEEVHSIIQCVGQALQYAHDKGVIHRDVKPANVLLDASGTANLTDFDLVRAKDSFVRSYTHQSLGTFFYSAPELLQSGKKADARSDVFSLGMTALFGFSGSEFEPEDFRHPDQAADRLGVPSRVKAVLKRATDWKPDRRFPTIGEFRAQLRRAFESEDHSNENLFLKREGEAPSEPSPPESMARWEPLPAEIRPVGTDSEFESLPPIDPIELFHYYGGKIPGEAHSAEDASALYEAIGYACQAGRYRDAFEVYWKRIHHNGPLFENQTWYGWYRLGLYSADLGALGWFYSDPWEKLQPGADADLDLDQKIMLRYATAECLRTQGLAREAGHPLAAARNLLTSRQPDQLVLSAIVVGWECERQLLQGDFEEAEKAGKRALELARRSVDPRQILSKHGRLGDMYLQMGNWKMAQYHFDEVLVFHRVYLKLKALPEGSPIAGLTGFLYGAFLLTRAEIVLGEWDPKDKYLGEHAPWDPKDKYLGEHAPSKRQAQADLKTVEEESRRVAALKDRISLYDMALYDFLAQRARAIYNIAVTGAKAKPDPAVHLDVNRNLRELEKQFDQVARGETPRLLVERSKVLRRLRVMGQKRVDEDGDLLLAAARCLDRAADIATYGKMKLHEADILLERTKVFLCQAKYPDPPASAKESRANAEACFKQAHELIRGLNYKKRYPELEQVALQLDQ